MVAVRLADALLEGRGGAGCPNLLQRPGSRRGAGRESLIFRASSRGRSRRGAPLQQIWTGSGSGRFRLRPTWLVCPISFMPRSLRSLPKRNMAPWEDRSGAHPTAAPPKPRNHAEVNGHIRDGGANDPPRTPESGRAVGSVRRRWRPAPPGPPRRLCSPIDSARRRRRSARSAGGAGVNVTVPDGDGRVSPARRRRRSVPTVPSPAPARTDRRRGARRRRRGAAARGSPPPRRGPGRSPPGGSRPARP